MIPPFFRYTFIVNVVDTPTGRKGREKIELKVEGVTFTFWDVQDWVKEKLEKLVWDVFYYYGARERYLWDLTEIGVTKIFVGRAKDRVSAEEARGLGFYYYRISVNEIEVERGRLRK